jgi:hypothetical protein
MFAKQGNEFGDNSALAEACPETARHSTGRRWKIILA